MPHLTGAQAVIATLRAHGVDTIFGIPGVHTLSLYDAMRGETGLRHILARHEQGQVSWPMATRASQAVLE